MATPRPIRSMDPYAQAFWAYTQKKEFRLQQCSECHKFRWPPGPSCDHCLSDQCEWALMKGRGTVLSWTTFHRAYFPEYPAPHTSIVLELDEGPLFVSYPVGIDAAQLREGMVLTLQWTDGEDTIRSISFARVRARGRVAAPNARGAKWRYWLPGSNGEIIQSFGLFHIPPNLVVKSITAHRKPPDVRICRLRNQSRVGTVPPSTSTPHWPACCARRW